VRSGTAANLNYVALSEDGNSAVAVGDAGTVLNGVEGGGRWAPQTAPELSWFFEKQAEIIRLTIALRGENLKRSSRNSGAAIAGRIVLPNR
jgi:hypothetical protein